MTLSEAKARWASLPLMTRTLFWTSLRGMPSAIESLSSTGMVTVSPSRTTAVSSTTIGTTPVRAGRWTTEIWPVVRLTPSLTEYVTCPARPDSPAAAVEGCVASMRTQRPW